MTRPSVVIICGQPFRVEGVAEGQPLAPATANNPMTDLGCLQLSQQRIAIRDGQAPNAERDTLLHEVLHSILHMTSAVSVFKHAEREEVVVNALAVGVLDVLRRNPAFVTWLTE